MPEDNYVCSLSPAMVEVARIELRETESRRTQALEQFRELIRLHPRIRKCQTDSITLLRFLRVKKYSVMAALEMLENYLTIRIKDPHWYDNLSLEDSQLKSLLDSGHICPLIQKDRLGRQVIIYGCTPYDANKFSSTDAIRLNTLIFANFFQDENIQVAGIVVIYDASVVTMQVLSSFSITDVHNWFTGIQKGIPMRLKQIHMLNLPAMANVMFKVGSSAMGQKVKSRIEFHANLEEFLEKFEDRDILPKEFGGKISCVEMNEKFKESLRKNQEKLLAMDDQFIEQEVGVNKTNCGDGVDLAGSFRKLEVD